MCWPGAAALRLQQLAGWGKDGACVLDHDDRKQTPLCGSQAFIDGRPLMRSERRRSRARGRSHEWTTCGIASQSWTLR